METQREILRDLARQYAQGAAHPRNRENEKLYRAVNGLRMIRPVVLIDEEPWNELEGQEELRLRCQDPDYRGAELYLRRMLYRWNHYPADMILPPYLPVYKMIGGDSGFPPAQEELLDSGVPGGIVSHRYADLLACGEDLERFHMPAFTYEKDATGRLADKLREAVGDLLPVRITGHNVYGSPWDMIAMYRGVENLLYDLADRPEHTHAVMERIADMYREQWRQFEELGLLEGEPVLTHCTPALCDELHTEPGEPVLRRNVWGRSMAQIFASVSPAMYEEFEISYQKKLMAPFGLVYYGCCEPLDKKMDVIKQIPHLRKISISPWADARVAAEAAGKDYVLSLKPNPAFVGVGFDPAVVRRETEGLLEACARYGCSCELILKDISTVEGSPRHLEQWEKTVMEVVRGF